MIKLLGCVFIVASAAGVGFMAAEKLKQRVAELEQSMVMLQIICDELRYTLAPMDCIFYGLCHSPVLRGNKLLICYEALPPQPFHERLEAAFEGYKGALRTDDIAVLREIQGVLGRFGAESQIASLEGVVARLCFQRDIARTQKQSHGKLYKSLSVLFGIALCLVVV